jgi:hypothetical protein
MESQTSQWHTNDRATDEEIATATPVHANDAVIHPTWYRVGYSREKESINEKKACAKRISDGLKFYADMVADNIDMVNDPKVLDTILNRMHSTKTAMYSAVEELPQRPHNTLMDKWLRGPTQQPFNKEHNTELVSKKKSE